ncbi:hypothetical protein ACWDFR_17805 [Streptomyces sp. 900105755]
MVLVGYFSAKQLFNKFLGCLYRCLQARTLYAAAVTFAPAVALAA